MARLFGTDGVRGVANDELTPLLAMQLGQAGATVLTKAKDHKPTIMVGCDTRISGDMLANALMAGVCSVGANAVYVGVVPTPAVAYLTRRYRVDAGVVISASHNPVEFNGIKFFDADGYKLPDAMEDEIEALIRNNMTGVEFVTGPQVGRISYRMEAKEEYINHSVNAVNIDLSGIKMVVDCAEGASHYTSIEALRRLGAEVIPIHNHPDGTNINANCGSTHMQELQGRVVYEKADIGIAFDGDADRCLAVDENGKMIDGDQIMAIVGNYMKDKGKLSKDKIVVTVMSNLGFTLMAKENGIDLEQTKVGDRYVLERMKEIGANLGGEQSGHIIFLDENTTGDGLLVDEISYLPQQTDVQRDFPASVREIVLSGCQSRCGKRPFYNKEEKQLAVAAMEKLGITHLAKKCYRELSGGQQQRTLLARALCAAQKMLLLDEPVTGLDPAATEEMYSLIQQLNKDGITIIMISHDTEAALKYASHVLHIGNGANGSNSSKIFFGDVKEYDRNFNTVL